MVDHVYLLKSGTKTYVGYTINLARRLRQHNGKIKGGAKRTRGRKWKLYGYLTGFEDEREARQVEWIWQHTRKSLKTRHVLPKRGIGRVGSLKRKLCELESILAVYRHLIYTKVYKTNARHKPRKDG